MKMTTADLFRRIQHLSNTRDLTKEEFYELDFYNGFIEVFQKLFVPGNVGTLIEINLYGCPVPQAEKLANALGFYLVTGSYSQTIYLSWPDKVKVDE